MLITLVNLFTGSLINSVVFVLGGIGSFSPSWLNSGTNYIFSQVGILDLYLPMYPHPDMSGPAGVFGIMTVVGVLISLMTATAVITIVMWILTKIIQIIPWNTQK